VAALLGLLNRNGPTFFLDYGIYDDPNAQRTNGVFLDEAVIAFALPLPLLTWYPITRGTHM
jgi:hypothetical protein